MFKKFDKMYVGVRDQDKMAFMVPDGDDAAAKNRKATVDNWTNKGSKHLFDNVPTKGFKVVGSSSRYSTSNKFVKIEDPRGFVLEVSIANIVHIAQNCDIIRGEIQGELVWVREKGNNGGNTLIRSDSDDYKNAIPFDRKKLKEVCLKMKDIGVGDVVVDKGGKEWVYCGKLKATFNVNVSYTTQVSWGNAITKGEETVVDRLVENKPVDLFVRKDYDANNYRYGTYCTGGTFIKKVGTHDVSKILQDKNYLEFVVDNNFAYKGEAYTQWKRIRSMVSGDGHRASNTRPNIASYEVYAPRGKGTEE